MLMLNINIKTWNYTNIVLKFLFSYIIKHIDIIKNYISSDKSHFRKAHLQKYKYQLICHCPQVFFFSLYYSYIICSLLNKNIKSIFS